jgi:hypothetical protein
MNGTGSMMERLCGCKEDNSKGKSIEAKIRDASQDNFKSQSKRRYAMPLKIILVDYNI